MLDLALQSNTHFNKFSQALTLKHQLQNLYSAQQACFIQGRWVGDQESKLLTLAPRCQTCMMNRLPSPRNILIHPVKTAAVWSVLDSTTFWRE